MSAVKVKLTANKVNGESEITVKVYIIIWEEIKVEKFILKIVTQLYLQLPEYKIYHEYMYLNLIL